MKLLTLVVPSYNVEGFLRRCVERMVPAGPELDVLIVDDGSRDGTPALADQLAEEHPGIVRVIHQENGGHGEGLNQGIREAEGIYLKSVDADDRIDTESLLALMELLRAHATPETWADLVVNDYVYDHLDKESVFQVRYNHVFHANRVDTWETCRYFPMWKQFMIHSMCYRVALLREHHYELPKHTFYEDNLYIYQPLPWVKTILYLHRPLYGYTVGQENQSVSQKNILRRMDQNTHMITQMICTWTWAEMKRMPCRLRKYMISFLSGQILAVTVLHESANNEEARALNREMWERIQAFDPELYRRLRHYPSSAIITLPGPMFKRLVFKVSRTAQKQLGF
ncbi:MAG: glycosyltransferase family 2 protein [Clostridia bacterium]|nr:glycosyltransferase family 2 protein [Clostridia bacterium]